MEMQKVAKAMERVGIPGRDAYELPTSEKRKLPIHRVISVVMGATLLDKKELKDFAQLAAEAKLEVILTPGPRSAWDTGRQLITPEGAFSGLRFRGSDQLRYVIADIMRAIELGFRGFLVIDEGLLWLLNELKRSGDIPKDVTFKVSIYAGHANAAGGRVLQMLGAGTFNPVADLSLPQLASIRKAIDIPMDLHIVLTESFGGYLRFYDGPEMARVCAPCYFKIEHGPACAAGPGALYKPWTSPQLLAEMAREKVKYAQIIHELIAENFSEAVMSKAGTKDLAIPKP